GRVEALVWQKRPMVGSGGLWKYLAPRVRSGRSQHPLGRLRARPRPAGGRHQRHASCPRQMNAGFGDFADIRGRLIPDAPLAPFTWFRVGGPAELLSQPADTDDLALFLQRLSPEVPVTVIGVGSNLLVRDAGIAGVTIRLSA